MEFTATKRDVLGSSASRRLRRAGRVPAIVYGGESAPANIELDHNEIFHLLRKEAFYSSILKMNLGGKVENVLLRTTQWHAYKPFVLHVDFQRVNANEEITIKVPLHFANAENSPAVKLASAMISHISNELEIVCLPSSLPQFIEVDLAAIEVGQTIHASELKLPKGVSLAPNTEESVIVSAVATQASGAEASDAEGSAQE